MSTEPSALLEHAARAALIEWGAIARLRAIVADRRAHGDLPHAMEAAQAMRPHHLALDRLAHQLGLPRLTRHKDVAAFARTILPGDSAW